MIIRKISLKNIRSYENEEIIFPEGSTVLAGDIGSGKTSVLLAIEFALFGLQPGQKGSGLLRNGKDEAAVALEIETEGKTIKIERGLKKSKSVNQSFASIEIEGKKQEMSVTELKTKVLELLNYPKEFAKKTNLLYRFTVYTPQEEMKQIITETSDIRLDTLRYIFGIDKYKRIRENAVLFSSSLREEIRNLEGQLKDLEELKNKLAEKQAEIIFFEKKISILSEELEARNLEKMKAETEMKELEEKIKEKEKFEQEAEKTKIMILAKKELLSRIEREKQAIEKEIFELQKTKFSSEKLENLEAEIKEKEKLIEEKSRWHVEILTKIKSLLSKSSELDKLKSQIASLELCPTCFQNVPEDYKKNVLRKFEEDLQKTRKETEVLSGEKILILKTIEELNSLVSGMRREIDSEKLLRIKLESVKEKESKLLDIEKQKALCGKDIVLLEKHAESMKESSFLFKKYDLMHEQKKQELASFILKEKEKEIELARTHKEKEISLKTIEEIKDSISAKEKLKSRLGEITELEDWLSSSFLEIISFTEKNIMLKLREEFSKLFDEWFNILVPEIFSVHLDEEFTPVIEQKDFQLDYSFLSGGERTAIALAYRLALNQIINSLLSKIKTRELVILDEPTDGFSEQQLDKMRDVLQELKLTQLIIVSHESKIESFVENIIRFRKEEGITRVER